MKKIKIGVIGTGRLGGFHTKILSGLPDADFVGIFDVDEARMRAVADEFGVATFDRMDDLLERCDAVVVASTTSSQPSGRRRRKRRKAQKKKKRKKNSKFLIFYDSL